MSLISITNRKREVIARVKPRYTVENCLALAITKGLSEPRGYRWTVTHVPTGQRVASFKVLAQAQAALYALASTNIPWAGDEKEIVTVENARRVREIASENGGLA